MVKFSPTGKADRCPRDKISCDAPEWMCVMGFHRHADEYADDEVTEVVIHYWPDDGILPTAKQSQNGGA